MKPLRADQPSFFTSSLTSEEVIVTVFPYQNLKISCCTNISLAKFRIFLFSDDSGSLRTYRDNFKVPLFCFKLRYVAKNIITVKLFFLPSRSLI